MEPEDAARFQQEVISHPELAPVVPQRVRDCIERLRTIYSYGVLWYDFFTVAYDQAQLALEFTLRERFLEFTGVPYSSGTKPESLAAFQPPRSTSCNMGISRHLTSRGDGWRLVVRQTGATIYFDGMLGSWSAGRVRNAFCEGSGTADLSLC
jgi:hypothetical protein